MMIEVSDWDYPPLSIFRRFGKGSNPIPTLTKKYTSTKSASTMTAEEYYNKEYLPNKEDPELKKHMKNLMFHFYFEWTSENHPDILI